ncbi:branched-chain amino acid ABC transporter permease [Mesobacillus maritimus]|uniref:branched-chain amino acid ABC transporter permease n=1 Tax=Mesobacillus maritimus TaxID=1643336 RepID=UPI0020407721|nr:branched-chain amino acid ABC transporter permease [Mesobacillus maritimus]MCM3584679.1 branched-chain amino acid ABC transporter permease [Mesobacillus maritimus]
MIKKYKGSLGIITLLTVTLAIFPFINDSFYLISILTLANLYAVFVVSWDIVSGFTGKLNLGHALFIGIGAYSVGILHDSLGLILSILVGVVLSILVAFIIGKPTMKLHGPFFSLTTMVLPLILFQLAYTYRNLTGGEFGLNVSVPLSRMELYYVTLAYMFISVLIIFFISRSRTGKILLAIKEDETACSAIGNNVERYKLMAFLISAFFAGLGGGLLALYLRHVGPNVFELWQSATILIMGIVGGMGTIIGPFLSAYGLTFLSEWLRGTEEYQDLIYAGLLILSILILPNGLASVGAYVKRKFKERGKGTDDNVSSRELNESLRKSESG